jgi:hypothetical protein
MFSSDQQGVSVIGHFCGMQYHLILSYDQQGVSDIKRQSHYIFSYDQKGVSDIAHICERQSYNQ